MGKATMYDREINDIQNNSRRAKTQKISKLEEKKKQKEIEAYYFYAQAHKKLYTIYRKNLKQFRAKSTHPDEGMRLEKSSSIAFKKSKKFRRKAENKGDIEKAYPLFTDAFGFEIMAINHQIDAFSHYQSTLASTPIEESPEEEIVAGDSLAQEFIPGAIVDSIIVEEPELPVDSLPAPISTEIDSATLEEFVTDTLFTEDVAVLPFVAEIGDSPDSLFVIESDTMTSDMLVLLSDPPDSTEILPVLEAETPPVDIFFGIQILSKSSPATEEQLKQVYPGIEKPYLMQNDSYFRYLVGKFNTLFEAKVFQNKSQVKGFIVAYKDGEKIPVQEAVDLLREK